MKTNIPTLLVVVAMLSSAAILFALYRLASPPLFLQYIIQLAAFLFTGVVLVRFIRQSRTKEVGQFSRRRPLIPLGGLILVVFSAFEIIAVPQLLPQLGQASFIILIASAFIFMIVGVFLMIYWFLRLRFP